MSLRSLQKLLCVMAASVFLVAGQDSWAANAAPESPRLAALQHEIETGNTAALVRFWQFIEEEGAPVVETIEGNEEHVLLTFLWHDEGDTENVILFSPLTTRPNKDFTAAELARSHLRPLQGTDIWYRTFRVRRDFRLSYYLSHNDSLLPANDRSSELDWASLQPDPLNPKRYELVHEVQVWTRSAIDGPGAEPVPWVEPQENVPKGRVEAHSMVSEHLGHERQFWIYAPPAHSPEVPPHNLLVLFDGWLKAHMEPTVTVLDNLLAAGEIEPTVAVMVGQRDRMAELTCNEAFMQFLTRELVPWVRDNYHVTTSPARSIVGGGSAGGLGAVCVAWRHPDVFGNVISQSGYFSWDPLEATADADAELEWEWITRQLAASPRADIRMVLSVGILEHDHDFRYSPSLLQANRHMRDVLLAKGYEFTYREVAGGHDIYSGALTFPDLLITMTQMARSHCVSGNGCPEDGSGSPIPDRHRRHENAIDETYERWVEAANAKDIETWSSFLAPGAVFMPPNSPILDTEEDIRGFYLTLFQDTRFQFDCTQVHVEVAASEGLAWSYGQCRATFSDPQGNIGHDVSKWSKVWKRMPNGQWKCALNTWNSTPGRN